jgi:MFS family permease
LRQFYNPSHYYGWVLVVTLGVTTIVSYGTTSYAFGVLVVPIADDLGWARATIAGALSVSVLLAGVLGVPIGQLVDRYGARWVMAVGSLVGGASLLGLSQVHAVWQFYLLWGGGIGLATALTFYSVSFTVVANWFERRRGSAMAWLTTIGGLASPVYIPLTGWLVPTIGWRDTVVVLGLTQLLIALPLHALLLRRHPEDLGLVPDGRSAVAHVLKSISTSKISPTGMTTRVALGHVPFWTLTAAAGVEALAATVVSAHQIALMISRGFDPVFAAGIGGIIGIMSLPGRFLLNWLSDRIEPQRLLPAVELMLGCGVVLLALATSIAWLYAYVLVYGLAFGTRSPLRASVMADHVGRRAYGAITAIQGIVVAVPAAVGPFLAGWLYDRLGTYEFAFWLTAASFIVSGMLVVLTPRPGTRMSLTPPAPSPG